LSSRVRSGVSWWLRDTVEPGYPQSSDQRQLKASFRLLEPVSKVG
jgi:hypothetical protein